MNHDLKRKLKAERTKITRLREEMQILYGYRRRTEPWHVVYKRSTRLLSK